MITPKRVAKNTMYTLGSALAQKLLTMTYFIIVARYYGPADQGEYSSALAFATLFSVFIDLGISSALTRETAQRQNAAAPLISQMFLLRIATAVIVYPGMIAMAYAFHYPASLVAMIAVAGVIAVIDMFTIACWFVLRGFQNLLYESYAGFFAVLTMVATGIVFIGYGFPITYLLLSVLVGSFVNLVISLFYLLKKSELALSIRPNRAHIKDLLRLAAPFAAVGIFARIYTFGDMTLLPALASASSAGWYAAAQKVMLALNIIPASLSSSLYPAMSASFSSQKERIGFLCSRGLLYLSIIVLPIAVGALYVSHQLVVFVYGEGYLPTARVFELLAPAIVGGFLSFPLGAALASANRQGINACIAGVCAFVNIIANIILIPKFAEQGAAIAASLTFTIQFFASFFFTREYIKPHLRFLAVRVSRIILASAGMAFFIVATRDSLPFPLVAGGSALLYVALVFFFRAINVREIKNLIFLRADEKNPSYHS